MTAEQTKVLREKEEVKGRPVVSEESGREVEGLKRLVGVMERREEVARDVVKRIEKDWEVVGEKAEQRERELLREVDRERRGVEEVDAELEEMESVLERINPGELL